MRSGIVFALLAVSCVLLTAGSTGVAGLDVLRRLRAKRRGALTASANANTNANPVPAAYTPADGWLKGESLTYTFDGVTKTVKINQFNGAKEDMPSGWGEKITADYYLGANSPVKVTTIPDAKLKKYGNTTWAGLTKEQMKEENYKAFVSWWAGRKTDAANNIKYAASTDPKVKAKAFRPNKFLIHSTEGYDLIDHGLNPLAAGQWLTHFIVSPGSNHKGVGDTITVLQTLPLQVKGAGLSSGNRFCIQIDVGVKSKIPFTLPKSKGGNPELVAIVKALYKRVRDYHPTIPNKIDTCRGISFTPHLPNDVVRLATKLGICKQPDLDAFNKNSAKFWTTKTNWDDDTVQAPNAVENTRVQIEVTTAALTAGAEAKAKVKPNPKDPKKEKAAQDKAVTDAMAKVRASVGFPRMSKQCEGAGETEWDKIEGLVAHGHFPCGTHWDPGVIDAHQILS